MFSWYCLSDPIYLLYSFKLSKNSLFALAVKANFSYFKLKHDMSVSLFSPFFFGTSVSVAVSRHSNCRLATMLVDNYFHHYFLLFFFFCSQRMLFSYNGSLKEKVSLVKVARSTQKPNCLFPSFFIWPPPPPHTGLRSQT